MTRPAQQALKIGIAGLGTVGVGVIKILQGQADNITARAGRKIEITAVSARTNNPDRGVDLSGYDFESDALALASRDDVDLVVELIGGEDGVAKTLAEDSLKNGKHFVTANKALVAHHGAALARLADDRSVGLAYEAAVAGGIPIIRAIRDGLVGNDISAVYGILNGTCNFILSEMEAKGAAFGDVLKDAQDKGYAEADPTFDIEGIDAAHKLALLAALSFGTEPAFDKINCTGISHITADDIKHTRDMGYRIKLIGRAEMTEAGLVQTVAPALVRHGSGLAEVGGAFNGVSVFATPLGETFYQGAGAGEGPTASSVVSDIVDIARGHVVPAFGVPGADLKVPAIAPDDQDHAAYYVRIGLQDRPGGIAAITEAFAKADISLESLVQPGHGGNKDDVVPVTVITHICGAKELTCAVETIKTHENVVGDPQIIPVAVL